MQSDGDMISSAIGANVFHMDCRCPPHSPHLTSREVDVLVLIAAGLHDSHVARKLGISVRTVAQRVERMMRRVDAPSRGALVARCYAAGALTAGVWPPAWSGRYCLTFSPV